MQNARERVPVWDAFVRFGHWTLVLAFAVAYLTAEELEDVHIWAGYWVGGYVLARMVWGFVGTRYARFSDFVRGPGDVLGYLKDLVRGTPRHYFGHNPAGGAMILALLLCLGATTFTGLAVLADSENEGPLAAWLGHPTSALSTHAVPEASIKGDEESEKIAVREGREKESVYEEPHELFANLTLVLIGLHLLGVLSGSLIHRENLVRAMITGYKTNTVEQKPPSLHSARKS